MNPHLMLVLVSAGLSGLEVCIRLGSPSATWFNEPHQACTALSRMQCDPAGHDSKDWPSAGMEGLPEKRMALFSSI